MKNICDVIIPFYNEGVKPLYVIKSLLVTKHISKIIVVDDGSDDKSVYEEICKRFPQVVAIRLETNSGKTNAVKEGLKKATAEYIFLFDGDLSNIKTAEVENTIEKITNNYDIDIIILSLASDLIMKKDWFRWYTILSGQRILRKDDFNKIYKKNFSGFQLEAAINDYMIKNKKKYYFMPSSIHNTTKYRKWGNTGGIKKVFSLFKELADCIGWRNLIWQTLFFCNDEIRQ